MTTVEHNSKPLMMSRIGRSGEYGYCFVAENADLLALIRDILEKIPGDGTGILRHGCIGDLYAGDLPAGL